MVESVLMRMALPLLAQGVTAVVDGDVEDRCLFAGSIWINTGEVAMEVGWRRRESLA